MSGADDKRIHISYQALESSCQDIDLSVSLNPVPAPESPEPQSLLASPTFQKFLDLPMGGLAGIAKIFGSVFAASANLSASRSSISFGEVQINSSSYDSFSVTNYGKCDANLSVSTSSPFSVSGGGNIEVGATLYINVTFSPYSEGNFYNYVSGNHGISVSLSGEGVDRYKTEDPY